jgi:hypothetical protein
MNQHSLFIVPADKENQFNKFANALGNDGPALIMALSANGLDPATHGWCAVRLSDSNDASVAALMAANPDMGVVWRKYDVGSEPGYPDAVLAELGLKRIVRQLV